MGASKSIKDMRSNEKEFDDWIADKEKQLQEKSKNLTEAQSKVMSTYYKENKYDDAVILASGVNHDFQHEADFTLKNLKIMIDKMGAALLSSGATPPGQKVDPKEGKNMIEAAKDMGVEAATASNIELYMVSKVFQILSSVIMGLGASAKLHYTTMQKSESLGFGVQLFTTVSAESYQSHSFFKNEYIYEYSYIYEVRFSLMQSKIEGMQDLVRQYQDALAAFEKRLNDLDDKVVSGELTGQQYEDQQEIWTKLIKRNYLQLQEVKRQTTSSGK